ncbi:MAG: hypothetical protein RLP44_26325 [Aggregatilineales bacterium]
MKKLLAVSVFIALLGVFSLSMVIAQTDTTVSECPGAPPPRLTVSETAQVAQAFSSLRADVNSSIVLRVMYRANNDQFTVTDGPVCAGPHYWWEVDFNGITGWVTEGLGSTYWVEPVGATTPVATATATTSAPTATPASPIVATAVVATPAPVTGCPGAPEPRLTVGGQGGVAQVFSTLRADIGSNTALAIMYRANNAVFSVVSGPVCSGPYYWWEVTFDGMTGWVTEGTGATYWLEPVGATTSSTSTDSMEDSSEEISPEETPESEG